MTRKLITIAKMINHSLPHPQMTDRDLRGSCEVALVRDVASGRIKPYAVPLAADVLRVRALGVTRVGATATKAILDQARRRGCR